MCVCERARVCLCAWAFVCACVCHMRAVKATFIICSDHFCKSCVNRLMKKIRFKEIICSHVGV